MITGTIGLGGTGKSLTTIQRLRYLHVRGRDIVSNTPLIDLRVKRTPGGFYEYEAVNPQTFGKSWAEEYIYNFTDIYNLSNCEVLIDEIGAWMPKHKHAAIPESVRRFLAQDRREGINLWWTHRTDRVFHEVYENTSEIMRCKRYAGLVIGEVYDPQARDEKPMRRFYWVNSSVYSLYQTLYRVGAPEEMDDEQNAKRDYGLGSRVSYGGNDSIVVHDWTRHRLSFFLTKPQAMVFVRTCGPGAAEALGVNRYELIDKSGRGRVLWQIPFFTRRSGADS